jgi:hypothetical protein
VVDSSDDLGVSREGEVDDGVQGVTASPHAWSASSFASGNGAGRRLEQRALRMMDEALDSLRFGWSKVVREMRR